VTVATRGTVTLLAIDTATPRISVALWQDGELTGRWRAEDDRRHGELLAPAIQAVTAGVGIAVADLTAVAVDVGPGLFTGLRVGVATAKALVSALRIPAVAVTSLEVLAHARASQSRLVAAVVDARRHEVFRAIYRPGPDGLVELAAPAVLAPDALGAELASLGVDVVAVGDGAVRYAEVIAGRRVADGMVAGGRVAVDADDPYPDASVAAPLAAARVAAGDVTDAGGLSALYLRQPDVRIGWARHDGEPTRAEAKVPHG
jgi:tRNA threonylcarbamoyladenosine biosynthesis protein TsaB